MYRSSINATEKPNEYPVQAGPSLPRAPTKRRADILAALSFFESHVTASVARGNDSFCACCDTGCLSIHDKPFHR